MNDKELPRVLILASAGVILFASMFSWMESWQHQAQPDNDANEQPRLSAAAPVAPEATTAMPVAAEQSFPASAREVVAVQARATMSTRDPMQPVELASNPVSNDRQSRARASRHQSNFTDNTMLTPPPPPGYATVLDTSNSADLTSYPSAPEKRVEIPLADQIRLVGLIDNKAIFTVPKSVAADLNLAHPSFTLAKGERVGNVVVESISKNSATVRDGKTISVKELQPIR